MSTAADNDLVLYHYHFSPYSHKIVWYLAFRNIDYAECLQPVYLPRPDLAALNLQYRRIPVLAHGRSLHCDTRQILQHLERAFPASSAHPSLAPTSSSDIAYAHLLEKWIIEGGIFTAAAGCLPPTLPAIADPKFSADRTAIFGRPWTKEVIEKNRGPSLVVMRDAFDIAEEQILGDGRHWVLGGDAPSRADLDVIWPFVWLTGIPGALPEETFARGRYPRTFAWIDRFSAALKQRKAAVRKPTRVDGAEAAKRVEGGKDTVKVDEFDIDVADPLGLKRGQRVDCGPTDYAVKERDEGTLVSLTRKELVLEIESKAGKKLLVHYPRVGYSVKALDAAKL